MFWNAQATHRAYTECFGVNPGLPGCHSGVIRRTAIPNRFQVTVAELIQLTTTHESSASNPGIASERAQQKSVPRQLVTFFAFPDTANAKRDKHQTDVVNIKFSSPQKEIFYSKHNWRQNDLYEWHCSIMIRDLSLLHWLQQLSVTICVRIFKSHPGMLKQFHYQYFHIICKR